MDSGELLPSPTTMEADADKYKFLKDKEDNRKIELQESSTTLNNNASNSTDLEDSGVGYDHWVKARNNFTQNHKPYNPKFNAETEYKQYADLADVEPGHFDTIYHSLVTGRKFQKPMPLSFVMLVIIHGWRKEGLVPIDWPPKHN